MASLIVNNDAKSAVMLDRGLFDKVYELCRVRSHGMNMTVADGQPAI